MTVRLLKQGAVVMVLGMAVGLWPALAQASVALRYRVRATMDTDRGYIEASTEIELEVAAGQDFIRLWVYPKRLEHAPSNMDEISSRWIYPGEVDLGHFGLKKVLLEGRRVRVSWRAERAGSPLGVDKAGAEMYVPVTPSEQPRKVRLYLKFSLQLPARFGRLGHANGQMSLAAPWYPLVLDEKGAFQSDATHELRIHTAASDAIYAGSQIFKHRAALSSVGDYVPVLVAEHMYQRIEQAKECTLRFISAHPMYRPPSPHAPGEEGLKDVVRVDTPGYVRDVLAGVCGTLQSAGFGRPAQWDVVEIPSRTELVASAPGVVLVSDRLFEIFPIEEALAFHRRALRQELFKHAIQEWSNALEHPLNRGWSAELRASLLNEIHQARHRMKTERPADLIGFAGFHPAVDQLLYAPQVAFEQVYFGAEELSPFRDDPVHAKVPWAHGARVLQSARLVMSNAQAQRFGSLALDKQHSIPSALKEVIPEQSKHLGIWLTQPLRPVNYRLGKLESRKGPNGRYVHRVTILREGAVRPEPVQVKVTDEAGAEVWGTWNGETQKGTLELYSGAPLKDAELDPQQRLSQSSAIADGHPRADDATTHPWRPPILQAFSLNVLLPDFRVQGFVDFALRKRYNIDEAIGFYLGTDPASTGGAVRYEHSFGPKVHNNRRVATAHAGVGFSRLHSNFSDEEQGGWRGTVTTGASMSTRSYLIDPRQGGSLGASVSLSGVSKDEGGFGTTLSTGVRGNLTLPIGLKQAIVLVGGVAGTVNPVLDADRQALGGRFLLRAFQPDELLGDARGFVVMEHRWTAFSDMAWNLLHLAWLREIQLAWFAGTGLLYQSVDGQPWVGAAEVGAGIHFLFDYGGIQPGVLALDVAVPLTRKTDGLIRNGELVREYSPLSFYISFDQYF